MTDAEVEAVARAVCSAYFANDPDYTLDEFFSYWGKDCRDIARAAIAALDAARGRHQFWAAGEPDCPPEIKAPNGELHTLRCKVCGLDNPRDEICRVALEADKKPDEIARDVWGRLCVEDRCKPPGCGCLDAIAAALRTARADALKEALKAAEDEAEGWTGVTGKIDASAAAVVKAVRALIDTPAPTADGWRPIETAPPNTTVLLFEPDAPGRAKG